MNLFRNFDFFTKTFKTMSDANAKFKNSDTALLPRILVLSVTPYNKSVQSRAFDSCFHSYPSDKLFQIFADPRIPCKGHCSKFYQIKDIDLLIHKFKKSRKIGKLFFSNDLREEWSGAESVKRISFRKRGILSYYLRKWIWSNKDWDTDELEKEISLFKPEAIFLGFSYDFFLFEIAEHFQHKFNVPIFYYIADDFAYNYHKKWPLYQHYYRRYMEYVKGLMANKGYGIFNSERIRKHFIAKYGLDGSVVYIPSEIIPRKTVSLNGLRNLYYFGNLSLGRDETLLIFSRISERAFPNLRIHVYAPDINRFKKCNLPACLALHKGIPYSKVLKLMESEVDGLLVVEGFGKTDICSTEFALSTKVGDYVCSGKPIIAFGPATSGTINFFKATRSGLSINNKDELKTILEEFALDDYGRFENSRTDQFNVAMRFFNSDEQSSKFRSAVIAYMEKTTNE